MSCIYRRLPQCRPHLHDRCRSIASRASRVQHAQCRTVTLLHTVSNRTANTAHRTPVYTSRRTVVTASHTPASKRTAASNATPQFDYIMLSKALIAGSTTLSLAFWLYTDLYTFDTTSDTSDDNERLTLDQTNAAAYRALQRILGDRVSVDADDVTLFGASQHSYHKQSYPQAVCTVESTDEVSQIVKICRRHNIVIIPYGSGTSLEGHTSAIHNPSAPQHRDVITINMKNMSAVKRISETDMDCTVQAGISWNVLNDELKPHGLWFPVDPGPGASIGGMVGCRCSGTNCVRHGSMASNILNLTVVLPDGNIIRTAQRARKSAAGFNLTQLFCGSEGTLGIVTEATLKLQKIPEQVSVAAVDFDNVHDAAAAAIHVLNNGVQIGCVELLDDKFMTVINKVNGYNYPLKPHIFFKFTGNKENVELDIKRTRAIVQQYTNGRFQFSKSDADAEQLWDARKNALWSTIQYYSPKVSLITDVCVPVSRIADGIAASHDAIARSWLPSPIVAHIGDGNFHALVMFDPTDERELEEAKRLSHYMVKLAIEADGTCTGEHGVGVGKKQYLVEELGEGTVDLMRKIKRAIDPTNMMNPGKVFDMDDSEQLSRVDKQYDMVTSQDNTIKPNQQRRK